MDVYRKLLRYIEKVKIEILFKALLGLITSATFIIQAILITKVINLVWNRESVSSIIVWTMVILVIVGLRGYIAKAAEIQNKILASKIKSKLRFVILDKIYELGPGYMSAKRSGKVTSLLLDGIESLEHFFVSYVPQMFTVLISGGFIVSYLCRYDLTGGMIILFSMILCIAVPMITVPLINRNVTDYWSGYSVLTSQYIDTIQGMTTLKTLNAEPAKGSELEKDACEFYRKSIKNTGISLFNSAIMLILSTVTSSITVVLVAMRVNAGLAPITAVTAFLFLAVECARPMMDLNRYWHSSFLGLSVAQELFELIEKEVPIKEPEKPDITSFAQGMPSIKLENVSFTYSTGTQAIKQISLKMEAGKTVALVGHSGSGKSTILNLLLRIYDVSEGRILINGINIRDYGLEYLRKNIAVVFQESYLFNDTIANNIRMANQQASDEDVIMAAKAANIHEFISSLPDGYQTIVGERGQTLSGGERQRISIARALLKDAPLLLLDEATSSVDAESEALIQASLNELMKNHTTIIVAHRLSTVQDADLICVLENGMIAETGTHEQLLEKKGVYYKLVQAQEGIRS